MIPEIFKGIKRLHDNKIYHCDLKPQNVFYLDKEQTDLVIGDYGSAKTYEQSYEKELTHTTMAKGTNPYLAPEQARGIVSTKNDYYSFGMTILHLLYPEHSPERKSNLRRIIERQFSGMPILSDFHPKFHELNSLIAGLTLQDINKRWGRNDIERWLAGEEVEVEYRSKQDVLPIKLGSVTIRTDEDLVNYIESDQTWYENLIEDAEGYGLLLAWLSSLQDLERKKAFERMTRYYQQDGKGYVKEAILRYFVPERPVSVEMKSYNFWHDEKLSELEDNFFKHLDDIWKITKLVDLKFYVFQFEFCLRQLEGAAPGKLKTQIRAILEKISALFNVSPKEDFSDYQAILYPQLTDERLLDLFYAFNDERVFRDLSNSSIDTIEEVGFYFAKHEELFENKYMRIERGKFVRKQNLTNLSNLSYEEFLFSTFNDKMKSEIEFCDIEFDKPRNRKITIKYKIRKSLTEFFLQNAVQKELGENSQTNASIVLNKGLIGFPERVYVNFIDALGNKHNITERSITRASKAEFKRKLKRQNYFIKRQIVMVAVIAA
ncbi:MAG: protein kinase, partial [bacterium]